MEGLTKELKEQMDEASKLDELIWKDLGEIGYGS